MGSEGAYIGSVISARYGRRMTIFTMSLWAIVTATILVTSGISLNRWQVSTLVAPFRPNPHLNNDWQLLVGRVLNYIYIGMELSSVPVYQAEVVPTPIRGFMVGSYQVSLGIGGLIINTICKATSRIPNNNAWMIPYGLYFVIPTFVASCVWFIPEVSTAAVRSRIAFEGVLTLAKSPRWLLMKGRDDQALDALRKLRGKHGEVSPETELEHMRKSLFDEADKGTYADLFKGHNRRRTLITIMVAFFFQATGQVLSGHYGAVFVRSLGHVDPFTITVAQSGINTLTSFAGILMIDRVGRR